MLLMLWALTGTRAVERTDRVTVATVEVAGGSHAIEIPLRKTQTAAHTRKPVPNAEATAKTILPIKQTKALKKSGGGAPAVPHAGDGSGMAQAGNGSDSEDAHPAFPIFSPRPAVTDRALLPAAEERIVVDVKVNELGDVVSEDLVKGMGNQLDQIVLETVKSWRFQPATVNGKPVTTEAELIFPFDMKYPVGGA
ncbi:MAG: TonB family protein [Terracidiphilus sp.]